MCVCVCVCVYYSEVVVIPYDLSCQYSYITFVTVIPD